LKLQRSLAVANFVFMVFEYFHSRDNRVTSLFYLIILTAELLWLCFSEHCWRLDCYVWNNETRCLLDTIQVLHQSI